MTRVYSIGVIGGDGIGPDVINEGLKVLDVVAKKHGLKFETTSVWVVPFPMLIKGVFPLITVLL